MTRDAEVEGLGTYDVTVAHDALTAVAMRSGTATVTVRGHEQPVFLSAGEVWHAEVVTAELVAPAARPEATPAPAPSVASAAPQPTTHPSAAPQPTTHPSAAPQPTTRPSAAPQPTTHPSATPQPTTHPSALQPTTHPSALQPTVPAWRPATLTPQPAVPVARPAVAEQTITRLEPVAPAGTPRRPSAIERHFQSGSTLLRANKLREAAIELAAAADASEVDPLSLDARYLQATALIGAGQAAEAESALVAFLDHAPHALRRGRAAVMLARLIAARGDVASARAWFTSALADPDRDVAGAAQAGLDHLPR